MYCTCRDAHNLSYLHNGWLPYTCPYPCPYPCCPTPTPAPTPATVWMIRLLMESSLSYWWHFEFFRSGWWCELGLDVDGVLAFAFNFLIGFSFPSTALWCSEWTVCAHLHKNPVKALQANIGGSSDALHSECVTCAGNPPEWTYNAFVRNVPDPHHSVHTCSPHLAKIF